MSSQLHFILFFLLYCRRVYMVCQHGPQGNIMTFSVKKYWSLYTWTLIGQYWQPLMQVRSMHASWKMRQNIFIRWKQPAMLFFDSLKLRDSPIIVKNILQWLNHEWDEKYSTNNTLMFSKNKLYHFLDLNVCWNSNIFIDCFILSYQGCNIPFTVLRLAPQQL